MASDHDALPRKLWEHPNPTSTHAWRFIQKVNQKKATNMQVCTFGTSNDPKAIAD